ncbi:hypothetical protein OUZ56_010105 [Daphnia magna]|uniref:SWIM-type domain-containing protein n=1 Tax=Daphnia magna TaxID=35525 RepID=A0ABR0AHZ1_9CRUS|nr:hypothetical protein OUZ56_010105 [Daphnia magna]
MSSAVISEPVITIFQLSDYAKGLVGVDRQTYLDKLMKCNIDCPYFIPKEHWVVDPAIIQKISPRQLTEHEVYINLIVRRSNDTVLQLKAMKTIETANFMVANRWVSKLCAIRLTHGAAIFKANVRHSMSFNSKKDLCTWAAVHDNSTVMAAHCNCTVGLGGVCTHVGGLLYSIIQLLTTPCTSKENS